MHIVICDDDKQALEKYTAALCDLVKKHGVDVTMSQYDSGEALLFDIEDGKLHPQILYLDIHMPKINGIDVADSLRKMRLNVEIVFLTVSREHWRHAFDLEAVNYIVKAEDEAERFEYAFLKAIQRVQDKQAETILLSCAGQNRTIKLRDISYFEVKRNVMVVHYITNGERKKFEFYSTLGRIEELVWGKGFVRVQRSYLVAISRIDSLHYTSLTLTDGIELSVGRSYYKSIREMIDKLKVS